MSLLEAPPFPKIFRHDATPVPRGTKTTMFVLLDSAKTPSPAETHYDALEFVSNVIDSDTIVSSTSRITHIVRMFSYPGHQSKPGNLYGPPLPRRFSKVRKTTQMELDRVHEGYVLDALDDGMLRRLIEWASE